MIYNIAFLRFLGPNLPGPNLPDRIYRDRIYRDRINLAPAKPWSAARESS